MSIYSEAFESVFTPKIIVEIEGFDATAFLAEVSGLDWTLDYPDLAVFKSGAVELRLDNSNDDWNRANASNWFVTVASYAQHGYFAEVKIKLGFVINGTDTTLDLFCGFLSELDTTTEDTIARVTAIDGSIKLLEVDVHNFGESLLTQKLERSPDYDADENPLWDFHPNHVPISKESIGTLTSDAVTLTRVNGIQTEGVLDYKNVEIDYTNGTLKFEVDPPGGSGSAVLAGYKTVYLYKRPDYLAREILQLDSAFADVSLVDRVTMSHATTQYFSTHGRPAYWLFNENEGVCHSMLYDSTADKVYMAIDQRFVEYNFATDTYTQLALFPAGDSTQAMTGFSLTAFDFSSKIYALMTDDLEADSDTGDQVEIHYWNGTVWTQVCDQTDEYPQLAFPYIFSGAGTNTLPSSRKGFFAIEISSTEYLYFIFANPNTTTAGVKRWNGSTFSTVASLDYSTYVGAEWSWDFAIDQPNDTIYHFVCYDDNTYGVCATLEVYTTSLTGTQVSFYKETFAGPLDCPVSATDLVLDEPNDKIYFMLQDEEGNGSLNYLTLTSPARTVIKSYGDPRGFLEGARSGHLFNGKAYYVEGDPFRYSVDLVSIGGGQTSTFSNDGGECLEIDNGVATSLGIIWRSRFQSDHPLSTTHSSGVAFGKHSACSSNMIDDGANLHFVMGYGRRSAIVGNVRAYTDFPDATDYPPSGHGDPIGYLDNYMWIQFPVTTRNGRYELASKIPIFPANDTKAWPQLEALAKVSNFELGFDCEKPFFRDRSAIIGTLNHGIAASGSISTITLVSTTRFPSGSSLPDGVGHVLIDQEIFSYTGKTATTLTGVTRAQNDSSEAAHTIGDNVYYLDHRAFNTRFLRNLVTVRGNQPDYLNVYNKIKTTFAGSKEVILTDATSITNYGERDFEVSTDFLDRHQRGWAEIIGQFYLDDNKDLQDLVDFTVQFKPTVKVGQVILINQSDRVQLNYRPMRILQVDYDLENWQTNIRARTLA